MLNCPEMELAVWAEVQNWWDRSHPDPLSETPSNHPLRLICRNVTYEPERREHDVTLKIGIRIGKGVPHTV